MFNTMMSVGTTFTEDETLYKRELLSFENFQKAVPDWSYTNFYLTKDLKRMGIKEEETPDSAGDYDIFVPAPVKARYKITAKVKSIRKFSPSVYLDD